MKTQQQHYIVYMHEDKSVNSPGTSSSSSAMGAAVLDDGTLPSSPVLDNVDANHLRLSTLSGPSWLRILGNISVIAAHDIRCG